VKKMKIDDQITVGPQPSAEELRQLKAQGYQTIVNFRTDGEEEQPLSPSAEGEAVRELGMDYVNLPVSMQSMTPEVVDQFRDQFADLSTPVYAHCKSGKRAGAMVMIHRACEEGLSGSEAIQQSEQMGFECDQPELKQFVIDYVDAHSAAAP
jgi:uncharacterized protein (TIGR01244 family)